MSRYPTPTLTTSISGHTRLVGLFGWPVEHSISPPMHNAAFRALALDWCYLPFAVRPADLSIALRGARALGLRGLNVTVPHKQAVLSLVDELTPAARAIQAVNTVIYEPDRIIGHNTDGEGFIRALRDEGFHPEGRTALLLGAGGAARAVCYALGAAGASVVILNRTIARAEALADALHRQLPQARISAEALLPATLERHQAVDLVINATSVGMWPHIKDSPWCEQVPFPSHALAYDLVYNPDQTRFMSLAQAAGARAVNGLAMLVHQGAAAFTLWTGMDPPIDLMLAACRRALQGD